MPQALAQQALDRDNLALTLNSTQLFLPSATVAIATNANAPSAAAANNATASARVAASKKSGTKFTPAELDQLLSVVYDHESKLADRAFATFEAANNADAAAAAAGGAAATPAAPAASVAAAPMKPFSMLDLLSLLRRWHVSRRKFINLRALRRAIAQEIGDEVAKYESVQRAADEAKEEKDAAEANAAAAERSGCDTGPPPPLCHPLPLRSALICASFCQTPPRHLLMPRHRTSAASVLSVDGASQQYDPDGSAHVWSETEIDQLLFEKNHHLAPANPLTHAAMSLSVASARAPNATKDVPLTNIFLFVAALKYLEAHHAQGHATATSAAANSSASSTAVTAPGALPPPAFLDLPELLHAVREHFKLISHQMGETLKYLKTAKRPIRGCAHYHHLESGSRDPAAVHAGRCRSEHHRVHTQAGARTHPGAAALRRSRRAHRQH